MPTRHKEISLQKRNESESSSSEGGDASSTGGGHHRKASTSSQHDFGEDGGQIRRLLVRFHILAGDDTGGEQLKGRPTKKSRIAILSAYHAGTLVPILLLTSPVLMLHSRLSHLHRCPSLLPRRTGDGHVWRHHLLCYFYPSGSAID